MRRLTISSITAVTLGAASAAQAQSSVTLYGMIDEAVAYYNNVGHGSVVQLQGGDFTGNQWGLKGKEDLGGGFSAIFNLQNGFNLNTGQLSQGGREFGKFAWVGLASDSLGSIRLGRQYDPTVDLIQPITADRYSPAFSTPGDVDNNDNSFRVDNSIKYTSPIFTGMQIELMYALGGVAGNVSSGGTSSAALLYTHGGLSLAGGYVYAKNDGASGAGTSDQTQNNSVSPLFGDDPFVGSRFISQAAAQYVTGSFIGTVRYSNAKWKPYGSYVAFDRTETFNTGETSLAYLLTPALTMDIGYDYTRSSGASSATYQTVAAGTEYSLSVRTTLYVIGAYSHAHGTTFTQDGNGIMAAGGTIGDLQSSSSTPNQVVFLFGITTKF
jgi:predicted porin